MSCPGQLKTNPTSATTTSTTNAITTVTTTTSSTTTTTTTVEADDNIGKLALFYYITFSNIKARLPFKLFVYHSDINRCERNADAPNVSLHVYLHKKSNSDCGFGLQEHCTIFRSPSARPSVTGRQTGPTPQSASGEEYNVVLQIFDIIPSPNFDPTRAGPIGGSDIAAFKVNDTNLTNSRNKINPACLPPKNRIHTEHGVHSGWTNPPPMSFIEKFAKGYQGSYSDFFKQRYYKMKIHEKCADPTKMQASGETILYPSNTYYPPATACATDVAVQSCFSTGDSGSPLMVREGNRNFIEGILSFVKGCEQFVFGVASETKMNLLQNSENPAAYTKLSCHLKWVAEQYGMSYEAEEDETCSKTDTPLPPYETKCRQNPGTDLTAKEYPCIFPFYYRGKGPYNQCMLFEEEDFVYPVFRCPTRNITTKFPGTDINHFEDDLALTKGYCYDLALALATCDVTLEDGGPDCQRLLDPSASCMDSLKLPPFSTCKNDCPGGDILMIFIAKLH